VLIVGGNQSAAGYDVDNSLRFNSASSDYLSLLYGTSGDRKTFTFSTWFKRGSTGVQQKMLGTNYTGEEFMLYFLSTDELALFNYAGGGVTTKIHLKTTQKFRDPSAWYHIVFAIDTTQATASDRANMYINGQLVTNFSIETYPTLNSDLAWISSTHTMYIGGTQYYSGYLAETITVDGSQLDETSFGEFDADSGIWKPIDVSGLTFGSKGFYLPYENSAALGQDDSGNGNNFTVNNLTSIDQTTDTPTNNYATANAVDLSGGNLSEGNTKLTADGGWDGVRATIHYPSSGKWYAELYVNSRSTGVTVGVLDSTRPIVGDLAADSGGYVYNSGDGQKYNNGSNSSYGATWGTGDTISVLWDADTNTLVFYKNGVSQGTAWSGLTGEYGLAFNCNGSDSATINFGNPSFTISSGNSDANGYGNFEYAVPSGYYALNTKNLAEYG